MAEPEMSVEEIARYCRLPREEVISWVEGGQLATTSSVGQPEPCVTLSALISCLDAKGLALPDCLKSGRGRVLIIDDDRPMARAIERVLRRNGYETFIADDGFTAGRLLEQLAPALITLDLSMPGLHGFDVLRYIRCQPRYRSLRVLVLSALPDCELQRAIALGADDVLAKPFDNAALQARIATMINMPSEMSDG